MMYVDGYNMVNKNKEEELNHSTSKVYLLHGAKISHKAKASAAGLNGGGSHSRQRSPGERTPGNGWNISLDAVI